MSEIDLSTKKRQAPIGVAILFLLNLRKAINLFIPFLFLKYGAGSSLLGISLYAIGIILFLGFIAFSYFEYKNFFFYAVEDKFIIERGVFRKDKTTIPFERIQTVHTAQNLAQQIFKVVGLKIDTAGSADNEIEIPALDRSYARSLQEYLLKKKEKDKKQQSEPGKEETTEQPEVESWEKPILKLSIKDLLKVGLTENHLRSGLILFAVVNGYIWQFEEFLLEPFEPYLEEAEGWLTQWVLLLPFTILVFVVVSVAFSLIRIVLRYYNLQFFLNERGLVLKSGLLKRNEFHVPRNKIQYFKWSSNPLRKLLGFKTFVVKQAGVNENREDKRTVSVPGCKNKQLIDVLQEFYPERYSGKFHRLGSHRLLFFQRLIWLVIMPSTIVTASFYASELTWHYFVPIPLFVILGAFWAHKFQRSVQFRTNGDVIEIKKGWIFPSHLSITMYKLQNVSLKRSIFQRRRDLSTLVFFTAAGDESMPHLSHNDAIDIYNFVLYKIESSQKSWM